MGLTDTIFALSSGALPAGLGVVRISGERSEEILRTMTGVVPRARQATYRTIRARDGSIIDQALILWFPGPSSFTGEDCVEFQMHGGRAVIAALCSELRSFPNARFAEPGEFTQRAFLNGKLDLPGAEALADLVAAETEEQRRFALASGNAAYGKLYEGWRQRLTHARAMIEAELDFSDESDIPGSVSSEVWSEVADMAREIDEHVVNYHRAEIIRSGFQVVILGRPNAGKSSLINALARRDVAIVSAEPGTTRDLIEVSLDLGGVKVVVTDTAGLREYAGEVESMGIARAVSRAGSADLVLHLIAPGDPAPTLGENALVLRSKADLVTMMRGPDEHYISAHTGEGIGSLTDLLKDRAQESVGSQTDLLPARLRHVELLRTALVHMASAAASSGVELQAEELRQASDAIGRISGQVGIEDLLDVIFSRFCIGK